MLAAPGPDSPRHLNSRQFVSLTILSVASTLAAVAPGSVGGAEQVLLEIDRGLVRRGHTSLVVARPDSRVVGTLIPTLSLDGSISAKSWKLAVEVTRKAIAHALERYEVHLVHMHAVDFADLLPRQDVPVLVTLHLARSSYKNDVVQISRPRTCFHCVSQSQRELFPADFSFLPDIENGIRSDLFSHGSKFRKRDFAASLGRICPEKGFHLALRAAKRARVSMILAGYVFPFEEHQRYFAERIAPELDRERRYIGAAGMVRKRRLLSMASCVIVPSIVAETGSLLAREALACGTPVVAFARGGLPEIVKPGQTGFLVEHADELPDAIAACQWLDTEDCKRAARQLATSEAMVEAYIASYYRVLEASCRLPQPA